MGFGAKSLGRKQFSRSKAKNLWIVIAKGTNSDSGAGVRIAGGNPFDNPITLIEGNFSVSYTATAFLKRTFVSPFLTFNKFESGLNGDTDFFQEIEKTHTDNSLCQDVPDLAINTSKTIDFDAGDSLIIRFESGGGTGGTQCGRQYEIQCLIQGDVIDTDPEQGNFDSVEIKKIS